MSSYQSQSVIQPVEARGSEHVNRLARLLRFPLTRILLGIVMLVIAIVLGQAGMDAWPGPKTSLVYLLIACAAAALCGFAYHGFVRLIERRAVAELALPHAAKELLTGLMISAAIFCITAGSLWMAGFFRVSGLNPWIVVVPALAIAGFHGVFEELLIRGIVFRIMEESLGTWLALGISALIFGGLHLANPNATLWGAVAIAIEAGIPLAGVFVLSRRLWVPIGMHIAWNFVQGGIFGLAVSGSNTEGLLKSALSGPQFLTGGAFGVEASVIVVAACLLLGVYLLWSAWKQGRLIDPFWTRTR